MSGRGVNKAIIIGNLGADPDIRYTASGDAVANLRIATSESWTDKQTGAAKEHTEWHRVILWRRLAEVAADYLHKGSRVYIEGKIRTRKWQDREGNDRYTTEIDGQEMQMLDGRRDEQAQGGYQQQAQPQNRGNGGQQGHNGRQQGHNGRQQQGHGNRGNGGYQQQGGERAGYQGQGGNVNRRQENFQAPANEGGLDNDVPF